MLRKYFFIPETLLGFGIFIWINHSFFQESTGFIGAAPHPYWVVILLIASRYGTVQGLFAGAVAAGLYIVSGLQSGMSQFITDTFPHGVYRLPFLFLLVGGILGEIRGLYRKRHEKLAETYQETVNDLKDLGVQHMALTESKQELDKRVAFQSSTMLHLFNQINELEALGPEELYKRVPELLKDQLNVTCASVYVIEDNKLRLKCRSGETSGDAPLPDTVELTEGLMGQVIRSKKVITVREVHGEKDLARFNKRNLIMSAPISRKDGAVVGVINVEKIPFFDFNATTVRIFDMLAHWFSVMLDKALQFQSLKDKNIADEVTGAYNHLYFQKRLQYEIARARRFKTPLSLLLLEVEKFGMMSKAEQYRVLVVLSKIFKNTLRETDIIFKYKTDASFAIMLPGQNSQACELVVQRLTQEIDNFQLRPFDNRVETLTLKTGMSTLQVSEGSYESLIATAEERLQQGGERAVPELYHDLAFLIGGGEDDTESSELRTETT